MARAQGSLYLIFNLFNYPRHNTLNGILRLIVDFEIYSEWLSFGWIVIDLLLCVAVNVDVVNFKGKNILWLRQEID